MSDSPNDEFIPKKPTRTQARRKLNTEQRRRIVEANYLSGASIRDIATQLDVSPGTVSKDIKAIVEQHRQGYADSIEQALALQRRRYEVLLNSVWELAKGTTRQGVVTPPSLPHVDRVITIMGKLDELFNLSGKLRPVGSDWERFALEDIRNGLLTYEALVTWFNEDTADRLFAEAGVESLAAQLFKQAQIDAELHDADEGDSSD